MHALQIARCPQGEEGDRNQRYPADEILRATDPFRHDGFDRPMARRVTHRSLSPVTGLLGHSVWIALMLPRRSCLPIFVRSGHWRPLILSKVEPALPE